MNRISMLMSVAGIFVITACGEKRAETTYSEPAPAEPAGTAPAMAETAPSIHWHAPHGWEKQSASDGITAMSYLSGNAKLTITPLQGSAGGVEANVQRWRRQAGLAPFSAEQLSTAIIKLDTPSGEAQIVKVADADTATQQIFGAILPYHGTTWFVKMTGPYADLTDAKWQEFQSVLKSSHPGGH